MKLHSSLISLTTYVINTEEYPSADELLDELTSSMSTFVEKNLDISTTIIHTEGSNEIIVKILKLNEHSN